MHSKDVLNMEKTLNTYSIFKIQPFELKNSCNKLYFDIQYSILSTYKSHFHLFYCEVLPEKRPTRHFSEGAHDGRFWRFGLQCHPGFQNEPRQMFKNFVFKTAQTSSIADRLIFSARFSLIKHARHWFLGFYHVARHELLVLKSINISEY